MKINRKAIIVLVALTIIALIIVAVLLFSGPRMMNQPSLRAFESRVELIPEKSVFYNQKGMDIDKIILPDANANNLEKGKVYYGYYCVFCHGEDGSGNGPVGQSYTPVPADLTKGNLQSYETKELYEVSFKGIGHEPVLERVISPEHRKLILVYLKESLANRQ